MKTADEIVPILAFLKTKVADCNRQYIERIELSMRNASAANASLAEEEGEQGRLNKIIGALNYDEPNMENEQRG